MYNCNLQSVGIIVSTWTGNRPQKLKPALSFSKEYQMGKNHEPCGSQIHTTISPLEREQQLTPFLAAPPETLASKFPLSIRALRWNVLSAVFLVLCGLF
jgi:hypothetical protein